ncbi:hypothetical protein [Streptomyces gossypii]|uniref:hypothetical protein n=1 Tax=Streptomyces gossypii TaxID=2883101 RepID=UPI002882D8F3|nr:hypothetical protein [Streptomyces gossypii]
MTRCSSAQTCLPGAPARGAMAQWSASWETRRSPRPVSESAGGASAHAATGGCRSVRVTVTSVRKLSPSAVGL